MPLRVVSTGKILIRGGCLDIHPVSRYNEISQKAHRLPSEEDFFMQIFQEQKPVQQQRPQMYAAVEILQLDVCQLQSYINTALLENPTLLRTPIVRNGRQATIGYCPDVWKTWE
jgi:arsenate reductase-like glutaredoxin family protein